MDLDLTIVFSIIGGWLQSRKEKEELEDGLKKIEPEIEKSINEPKFLTEVAMYQLRLDKGEKVYANYNIEAHFGNVHLDKARIRG